MDELIAQGLQLEDDIRTIVAEPAATHEEWEARRQRLIAAQKIATDFYDAHEGVQIKVMDILDERARTRNAALISLIATEKRLANGGR